MELCDTNASCGLTKDEVDKCIDAKAATMSPVWTDDNKKEAKKMSEEGFKTGMSGGAKAAIGIGAVGGVGAIAFVVMKRTKTESEGGKKESKKALKKLLDSKKTAKESLVVNEEKA